MEHKPLVQSLLEAGAHYGFLKSRRHPSTKNSIISTKNKCDLINLDITVEQIEKAKEVLRGMSAGGKSVILVATKPEAEQTVENFSTVTQALYVKNRWVGGIITNFSEIRKRVQRLITLRDEKSQGLLEKYTKKERLLLDREVEKMEKNFGGIVEMKKIPDIMIVVDSQKEEIAVTEAQKMQIPVIGIANTDCDISKIEYPIVMNDSSKASIEIVLKELANAFAEAKS